MRTLPALACLAALTACGPITFPAKLQGTADVEGSALGQLLSVFPQVGSFASLNFDENADFKNNKTTRDHVKSMRLTSLTVQIISPDTQDFSFLDSIEFDASADGLPTQRVASKANIGALGLKAPKPILVLDLDDVDVSPWVRAPTMTITTKGAGRQPGQTTRLEAKIDFIVGVGL
ncbi:MAG: hypothetical protein U0228_00595 [Myxococcaceae bacterium]